MAKFALCLVLALVSTAQAEPDDVTECVMAKPAAVNEMVDAALSVFAATKACDKKHRATVCVADIAKVVNAVLGVGEFMLKSFNSCEVIKDSNYDCAIAGTKLAKSISSVTSSAAATADRCRVAAKLIPGKSTPQKHMFDWKGSSRETCLIETTRATAALQSAIAATISVKRKCATDDTKKCVPAVLDIIGAVGDMAEFIEKLVERCGHVDAKLKIKCDADIVGLVSGLAETASAAIDIKTKCTPESTRLLFQDSHSRRSYRDYAPAAFNGAPFLSAMLVVLLSISGLAIYYGWSKSSGRRRGTRTMATLPSYTPANETAPCDMLAEASEFE
jgi:hypothetical protein